MSITPLSAKACIISNKMILTNEMCERNVSSSGMCYLGVKSCNKYLAKGINE